MINKKDPNGIVPKGLDPKLWLFLIDWDEIGIIQVMEKARTVRIPYQMFKRRWGICGVDEGKRYVIDNTSDDWKRKILLYIIRRCYDTALPKGTQPDPVTFEELQDLYERETGTKSRSNTAAIITTTTTRKKEENGSLGETLENSYSRVTADLPSYLIRESKGVISENSKGSRELKERKRSEKVGSEEFDPKSFMLSGISRNHGSLFKLDIETHSEIGPILKKIEANFLGKELSYSKNKWATIVKKEESRGYTLRIHEYGHISLHVPKLISLDKVKVNLREDLSILNQVEFDALIDAFVPNFGHFASVIYPEDAVKRYLAEAKASIWLLDEKLAEACVDKSAGPFELELKGNYFLCALLQEKMLIREAVLTLNEEIIEIRRSLNKTSAIIEKLNSELMKRLNE